MEADSSKSAGRLRPRPKRRALSPQSTSKSTPTKPRPKKRKPATAGQTMGAEARETAESSFLPSATPARRPKRRIRTLNLDPGFEWLGLTVTELHQGHDVILEMDLIRTEKASGKRRNIRQTDDNFRRAREICHELLRFSTYDVDAICFEAMSFVRSAGTMAKVGMCYGAIAMLVELLEIPVLMAMPQEVKKATGAKSKDAVGKAMFRKYRQHPDSQLAIKSFLQKWEANAGNHNHAWDSLGVLEACRDNEVIRALRR